MSTHTWKWETDIASVWDAVVAVRVAPADHAGPKIRRAIEPRPSDSRLRSSGSGSRESQQLDEHRPSPERVRRRHLDSDATKATGIGAALQLSVGAAEEESASLGAWIGTSHYDLPGVGVRAQHEVNQKEQSGDRAHDGSRLTLAVEHRERVGARRQSELA